MSLDEGEARLEVRAGGDKRDVCDGLLASHGVSQRSEGRMGSRFVSVAGLSLSLSGRRARDLARHATLSRGSSEGRGEGRGRAFGSAPKDIRAALRWTRRMGKGRGKGRWILNPPSTPAPRPPPLPQAKQQPNQWPARLRPRWRRSPCRRRRRRPHLPHREGSRLRLPLRRAPASRPLLIDPPPPGAPSAEPGSPYTGPKLGLGTGRQ